ncbi:MAG: PilZ domain-containing protein [Lachnospiraceae bacterium]|nr:PilZ domain-containing protein [Lachnospiraceae bacterium]
MGNEKRKSKRMKIDVSIKLNLIKNTKDLSGLNTDEMVVDLVNVSEDGIAFKTSEELKLNTFYDTHMVLWGKEEFDTVIEIVRMENTGEPKTLYGCRFIGIRPSDKLKITIHELVEESGLN